MPERDSSAEPDAVVLDAALADIVPACALSPVTTVSLACSTLAVDVPSWTPDADVEDSADTLIDVPAPGAPRPVVSLAWLTEAVPECSDVATTETLLALLSRIIPEREEWPVAATECET